MSLPILHYSRLPWPADWARLFDRDAPLLLELGFGGGDKLLERARSYPNANVLGIEISLPSLWRGARKVGAAGLQHTRILQGDSRTALWLLFPPRSISGVTIDFPDPWPKARHHHRRLINGAFLHLLATRLQPGAYLDIATDHVAYGEVIAACLAEAPWFESRDGRPFVTHIPGRQPTKYERIGLAEGRPPRYFRWRRNDQGAADHFVVPEEKPVPHVVLKSSKSLEQIARRFRPFHAQEEAVHLKYLELFRSLDGTMLLLDVYVSEEPYHQRVGLSVRQRREGDLVVAVQEIGFPRPTPGIHLAVGRLVAWLQEQDPDLVLLNSTLGQDLPETADR